MTAGRSFDPEIKKHLDSAGIILLLVSADFMISDYINSVELKRAMERHNAGEARVIPIILQLIDWKLLPFGQLIALPTDGKAVTLWANRDAAFKDITGGIRAVVCQVPEILVLPHLACSTTALLIRKEKQKEQESSSGAFHCIPFPFLYLASR